MTARPGPGTRTWVVAAAAALLVHLVPFLDLGRAVQGANQKGAANLEVALMPGAAAAGVEEAKPVAPRATDDASARKTEVDRVRPEEARPDPPREVERKKPDEIVPKAPDEVDRAPARRVSRRVVRPAPKRQQPNPKPKPKPRTARRQPTDTATTPPNRGDREKTATPDRRTGGGGSPGITPGYAAKLRAWLERHKRYPDAARSRREEGRVGLRFRMDRTGKVLDYRIVRRSGYAALDAAVADMIRRASPLPAPPPGFGGERITLSITIVFRLER